MAGHTYHITAKSYKSSGGARRSQEEPGEPGGARRSQEEPGGAIPVLGKLVKLAVTIGVGWHSGAFHG